MGPFVVFGTRRCCMDDEEGMICEDWGRFFKVFKVSAGAYKNPDLAKTVFGL